MSNSVFKLDNLKLIKIKNASTLEALLENNFLSSSNRILNYYNLLNNGYDKEALHQYRISIRRFKSFINFFKKEINNNERIVIINIIKMLLEPTSEARDFDVIKEVYISPCCDMHPADNEFSAIKNHSQIIQIELHSNACYQLSSSSYLKLLDKLQNWVNNKKWANRPTYTHHNALDENPEKLIKKIFKNRYHHILNDKKDIFSYKQKELHKLRVNAKELRVIIDELGFIIKNKKHISEHLKILQNILGKINDTYVAQHIISDLGKNIEIGASMSYMQSLFEEQRSTYLLELETL